MKFRIDVRRAYYHGKTAIVDVENAIEARKIGEQMLSNEVLDLRYPVDGPDSEDIEVVPIETSGDTRQ